MNEVIWYIFAATLLGGLLLSWFASQPDLSKFPVINPDRKATFGLRTRSDQRTFLDGARSIIKEGVEKFQRPFLLNTENGARVILPPSYVDAVKNDDRLSLDATSQQNFFGDYPGFEAIKSASGNRIVHDTVRIKLTQNLGGMTQSLLDEATEVIDKRWGKDQNWHTVDLSNDVLDLVAHLSARVFLGPELSHNEEWLRISVDYTLVIFNAARALRLWPRALRPIAVWFVPECIKLRATTKKARHLIESLLDRRRAARKVDDYTRVNDALEWMEEIANGRAYDAAGMQLGLTMAAIHTTTDLTKQALVDLAQHPQLVNDIRAEVNEVVEQQGWEKTSLYKMRLLDSAIKETQRMKPASIVSMNRLVLDEIALPDGTILPKGCQVVASSESLWDSTLHINPEQYDGARFLKLRQQPGKENSGQLVTVSSDHIAFGYGNHACPGRFFAANEVKISLAHVLMNYDLELVDPSTSKPMPYAFELMVNPMAKLQVRRRSTV